MATNLALDDALIEEAREMGRHATKRAAVTAALEEYVERRMQLKFWIFSAPSTSTLNMITRQIASVIA
jgi:hypothetical protein